MPESEVAFTVTPGAIIYPSGKIEHTSPVTRHMHPCANDGDCDNLIDCPLSPCYGEENGGVYCPSCLQDEALPMTSWDTPSGRLPQPYLIPGPEAIKLLAAWLGRDYQPQEKEDD